MAKKVTAPLTKTEAARQGAIENALDIGGWRWTHFRPAQTEKGWRTPLSGHPGFVDLFAVHEIRQHEIFIEVKADGGKRDDDQVKWAQALIAAGLDYWLCDSDDEERALIEFITGGKVQA